MRHVAQFEIRFLKSENNVKQPNGCSAVSPEELSKNTIIYNYKNIKYSNNKNKNINVRV